MENTIKLLKEKGIIEKLQAVMTKVKPPAGTDDESILKAIEHILNLEILKDSDVFYDAMMRDTAIFTKRALNIEYDTHDENASNDENVSSLLLRILKNIENELEELKEFKKDGK